MTKVSIPFRHDDVFLREHYRRLMNSVGGVSRLRVWLIVFLRTPPPMFLRLRAMVMEQGGECALRRLRW